MKLPRGTTVRCLKDLEGQFTLGKVYVVGGGYYNDSDGDSMTHVEKDDSGLSNGWSKIYFETVEIRGPW